MLDNNFEHVFGVQEAKIYDRVVRGKMGHFLDFQAFDQIKTTNNQTFTCGSKHSIY